MVRWETRIAAIDSHLSWVKKPEVLRLFQDNELFNMVITVAVLIFLLTQMRSLKLVPNRFLLLSAYGAIFLGSILTVVESILWTSILNIAEHASYALSAVLFSRWCWIALHTKRQERP